MSRTSTEREKEREREIEEIEWNAKKYLTKPK